MSGKNQADTGTSNADKSRKPSGQLPKIDPVEEASRESFPASDPPARNSQKEDPAALDPASVDPVEQLKQLAADSNPEQQARYKVILDQRDRVLTQALTATAKNLLKDTGYTPQGKPGNHEAVARMHDGLSDSSISEIDQRLLALVATEALFGLKVEMPAEDDALRLYPTDEHGLNPLIMLRLARALHRSPDQDALLWQQIVDRVKPPEKDADLIRAAITLVLDEIPVSDFDDSMAKLVINNTLGG